MIGLFKKKEKLNAETLHQALVLIAVKNMEQVVVKKDQADITRDLMRLQAAGLGNTVNATRLKEIQEENSRCGSVRKKVMEILDAYPNALIVPYSDFFKVMKKYSLAVGRIEDYIKPIPEKNIEEVYRAARAFDQLPYSLNEMAYINSARIDQDMPSRAVRFLAEYIINFPLIMEGENGSGKLVGVRDDIGRSLKESIDRNSNHVNLNLQRLRKEDWLIACPAEDIPDNTSITFFSSKAEERRKILEDPIIFKAAGFGVVIASMWGQEADDSIFDKYRHPDPLKG